jgi:photosystem II stability/assembly factor-like uncharacterized protein
MRLAPRLLLLAALALAVPSVHAPRPVEHGTHEAPSDHFLIQRAMPDGTLPSERIAEAYEQALFERSLARQAFAASASAQDWVCVGPYDAGGRVNAVVAAPGGAPLWVGAANGGIFLSQDQGTTFTSATDRTSITSIGALAVNPRNPRTLWVGTGDANNTVDGYDGTGVFVTRDLGSTWVHRGLRTTARISALVVDPADSNRIYVGAMGKAFTTSPDRGFYRSLDGGSTWTRTLFLNDSTGVSDIAVNPAHPETMYCATLTRVRRLTYRRAHGPDCGVWRSTDRGATWTRLGGGLPSGTDVGRIALAVAPSRPSRVYASVISGSTGGYTGLGLWRSDDGGATWARVDADFLTHRNAFGGFGWYFGRVAVAPQDADDVWVLGVSLLRSTDGGVTLADVTGAAHVDQHDLWLDPSEPTRTFLGNDGGFFVPEPFVGWAASGNLPISQFYAGTVNVQSNPLRIAGGLQDNGTVMTAGAPGGWQRILGGDGMHSWFSPVNTNLVLAEWQYACDRSGPRRSTTGGASWGTTTGWSVSDRYNWNMPIVQSPRNASLLLAGSQRVYRSLNAGSSWTAISTDLTTNPGAAVVYGTITTLAVSPVDSLLYLAGTDDGRVWRSQNAGATWENVSAGLPGRYVTRVVCDPADAQRIHCTFSGFGQDLHDPRVFTSANRGTTWQAISGNLPDAPVNDLLPDPTAAGTLYAGTDLGVFVTRNLGQTWTALGGRMPVQPVADLELHAGTRRLYAFTHGRSAWSLDLNAVPLDAPTARGGSRLALAAPSPNPARGAARIEMTLGQAAQVEVAVFDASGRRVRVLTRGGLAAGTHALTWDTRDERGARVSPGVFFVRAHDGATTATRRLVVVD